MSTELAASGSIAVMLRGWVFMFDPSGLAVCGWSAAFLGRSVRLLRRRDERLALFDDVGGKLRRVDAADVSGRMDSSVRDEQDVAGLERHRRLAVERVLKCAFDDVDDLLAMMRVPGRQDARGDVDAHLDGF